MYRLIRRSACRGFANRIIADRNQDRLNVDKAIIVACGAGDWEKMAKLRLSRTHRGRMAFIPVINPMLFGVLGAYWEDNHGKC